MPLDLRESVVAAIAAAEAIDYYESVRPGLGGEFLDELEQTLAQIKRNPQTFGYLNAPVRRAPLRRFPYIVIYEVKEAEIVVLTVFNTWLNPDSIPG